MAGTKALFLFTLFTLSLHLGCSIDYKIQKDDDSIQDFQNILKILGKPRTLDREKHPNSVIGEQLKSFKWSDCGGPSAPLKLNALTVNPDPVKIPGNITVSVDATAKTSISSPIILNLKVEKKVVFWIEIPCVDNIGSCNYPDVCQLLESVITGPCPPELVKAGIPCKCPYKQGDYKLPSTTFAIPNVNIPSWLESGDYKVTAELYQNKTQLGCIEIQASLG